MAAIEKVKVVVLGDSGVGKTSLTYLIAHNKPLVSPGWTVGCSVEVKLHRYKEGTQAQNTFFVELWDVGGSNGHRNTRNVFYQPTHGIILVHDLTNRKSQVNLQKWLTEILNQDNPTLQHVDVDPEQFLGSTQIPILVIGTKFDLAEEKQRKNQYRRLANSIAEQCGADEIFVNSHQARSLAPGASNSVKLTRFFDKMAAEIKLLARRICPTVSRFAVQTKYFTGNAPKRLILPDQCAALFKPNPADLFRQLEPLRPAKNPKLLQNNTNSTNFLKGLPKTFIFRRKKVEEPDEDKKKKKKRVPKLILIQNPLTWLMIKIDFSVLRNIWDSGFEEKEFKFGTKQAISKITNLISDGQYSELNGLLTKAARLSLMRELDRNWSDKQRSLLALNHDDIQISSPRKVYFIRIADKKYCDVDMAFLALKWAPINSIEALIFTEIFARFHREYTPHCIPEWTIAYFKVTRFEVLRRKAR